MIDANTQYLNDYLASEERADIEQVKREELIKLRTEELTSRILDHLDSDVDAITKKESSKGLNCYDVIASLSLDDFHIIGAALKTGKYEFIGLTLALMVRNQIVREAHQQAKREIEG